jgi:hypothetical protein
MRKSFLLLLVPLFALLSSCNTGNETTESYFSFASLTDSLKAYDAVRIVAKYSNGDSDVVFAGKVNSAADLTDLPALHYGGGNVNIVITALDSAGNTVYQVRKQFDGKETQGTTPVVLPDARLVADAKDISLYVGEAVPLPAVSVEPKNLADTTFSWTVSNSEAFLIDGGKVKGWHKGAGNLIATLNSDSSKHVSFYVSVTERSIAPESLQISPRKVQLAAKGAPATLTLRVVPNSAAAEVTWGVLNAAVAEVTQLGVVSGLTQGTTRVWVKSAADSNINDTVDVEVSEPAKVTGVAFLKDGLDLFVGGAAESLQVQVSPPQANQGVTLEVADGAVAEVRDGKIRGLSEGSTDVTARSTDDTSMHAVLKVKVNAPQSVTAVQVSPHAATLYTGGSDTVLAAQVTGATGAAGGA